MPIRIHTPEDDVRAAEDLVAAIRRVVVSFGPRAPRTVLRPGGEPVLVEGPAGRLLRGTLTVRNLQSAVVVVSPALTVLRRAGGGTWSPDHALRSAVRLLWPGESTTIDLAVTVAAGVPPGTYDGSLRCLGTTGTAPVRVVVRDRGPR